MSDSKYVEFYGGWKMSFIPIAVYFVTCVILFVVLQCFEMHALAAGAFLGLMVGAVFAKKSDHYWSAVLDGVASRSAVTVVVMLFLIGMFAQMMKDGNASQGFLWVANSIDLSGGTLVAFIFIACCILSTATGSSIGTMFATFPVFYESGIALHADPVILAGAITSGCIFGDNMAPISDNSIASANMQQFKDGRNADIAGVVSARFKYAAVAGIAATILFAIFGSKGDTVEVTNVTGDPKALVMLIPVVLLLITAIKTRSIFKAVMVGLGSGTLVGVLSGTFTMTNIFWATGELGGPSMGYIPGGVKYMMDVVTLVISVFGVVGLLRAAGALDKLVEAITHSSLSQTVRGTETIIAVGACVICSIFGGVTTAAVLAYGPVVNEIGRKKNIHPYRRANLLDSFVFSLPVLIPFLSAFLFIAAALSGLSPMQVVVGMFYPLTLFITLCFAVITGWGLIFEDDSTAPVEPVELETVPGE